MPALRNVLLALAAAAALGCAAAAPAAARGASVTAADALERPIVAELNRARAAHGLRPLRPLAGLARAAEAHAASMAAQGFFAHTSADGTSFDRRIARYYPARGYRFWTVGENLLWASPTVDPAHAVEMWLASPGHRRNVLDARFERIGIAAVRATAAPGFYGGLEVTIVATTFGARR